MGGWGETRGMGEEELTVISFYFVLSMSENVCNWTLMLVFWSIFMICMNLIVWQTLALYSDCWHFCQTFNLWSLEDMTDIDILHTLCDVFVCIFLGSVLTGIDVCVCVCVFVCVCVCLGVCVLCMHLQKTCHAWAVFSQTAVVLVTQRSVGTALHRRWLPSRWGAHYLFVLSLSDKFALSSIFSCSSKLLWVDVFCSKIR